jgi:hypothetical protein
VGVEGGGCCDGFVVRLIESIKVEFGCQGTPI